MRYRKIPCKTMIILFLFAVAALDAAAAELPITSPFGWRVHPITGAWRFHTGIDLGYDYGTPIPAMFDGIVLAAGDFDDGYGNQVVLYHLAYDTYTCYAHMQSISVAVDTFVPQGAILGFVGSTGNATGPHLHLEYIVRAADGGYTYTDPIVLWQ